jgi:isoquinoline 1-oxidoreductase subunit beta
VDLRRDLLAGNPRTLRALELAAESGGWGSPLPEGPRPPHRLQQLPGQP